MKTHNVDVIVCLNHKHNAQELSKIQAALTRIRGVRAVTPNNHLNRLVNVTYDPTTTRACAILNGVRRHDHSAWQVGLL
jgi:hypothetical protein